MYISITFTNEYGDNKQHSVTRECLHQKPITAPSAALLQRKQTATHLLEGLQLKILQSVDKKSY